MQLAVRYNMNVFRVHNFRNRYLLFHVKPVLWRLAVKILPGYPNATPRPRMLVSSLQFMSTYYLPDANILTVLIGLRNRQVGLGHSWVKCLFLKIVFIFLHLSLALILWLVRDDPIADYFVLYNTPHFDITTTNFKDGSLRLRYVFLKECN